jgi:hypothetical protein
VLSEKIIDEEAGRADDFNLYLRRVEYQLARVAENPSFDLNSESTRITLQYKSIDLMTALIKFFNSFLLYSEHSFFGIALVRCND